MKILILTSSENIQYARGADRVIFNSKEALNSEFELVLHLSGKNIYRFSAGVFKILLNNPFSFDYIIFNAQGSIRSSANPYWKFYYLLASVCNIKKVIYWHEMPYFVENYAGKSKSVLKYFKNRDIIQLCCSDANKQSAFVLAEKPIVTNINNCIVPRNINKKFQLSRFTVITVGTVDYIKGVDIWTEVAILVCKKNADIDFIWVGEGDTKDILNDCLFKIKEANCEHRISFLGKVEDATVLTAAAHLYYCSSRLDSFPLAILEAMNHGKNIIYYNSGGVVEAVGNDGFFIPDFSIENTAKVILQKFQEFKESPEVIFNKAVYDKFYRNYTPEIFVRKLKKALEQ